MIIVKVELHSAITGQKTELARMMIDNIGGDLKRGNYRARTFRGRSAEGLDKAMTAGSVSRFALLVWEKPNPMPMRNKHYLPDTEPFVHAWSKGHAPVGDHHDMHRTIRAASVKTSAFDHPTVKPDAVMDKIVRNVAGSTICDPFMGTGSTGVAAVKAGKAFVGIEQNPTHFETACRRIAAALEGTAP